MAAQTIAIVGAGAWGTALAQTAARAGREVLVVARDPGVVAAIAQRHANPRYLPGVGLDPAIRASGDLGEAAGADAVLLIVAVLEQRRLATLQARAWELGLATLVEVHDEEELARAVDCGARVIGVNNRNLRTLTVDVDASYRVAARMPKHAIGVSESGLQSRTDLERLTAAGYRAFLVGERFMTDPDPASAIQDLIAPERPGRSARLGGSRSVTAQ
jgi:indole-3-glycerol phosphate synthase